MLSVKGLSVALAGQSLLRDITLHVGSGEFLGILGPNGSGKTSLLRALSGSLRIQSGEIYLAGHPLQTLSPKERARKLAFLPQRTSFPKGVTVRDLVLLGRYPHLGPLGWYGTADYAVADRVLKETDTYRLRARRVATLSGGEMQRVLLAMVLAQEAQLLLVDELGAGLDVKACADLYALLRDLLPAGRSVLCVLHDANMARAFASRLIGIAHGRIVFDALPNDAFTESSLSELYATEIHVFTPPGTTARLAYPACCLLPSPASSPPTFSRLPKRSC